MNSSRPRRNTSSSSPTPRSTGSSTTSTNLGSAETSRPERDVRPGLLVSAEPRLVDVVLLPVERGVGLDDDVFVRGLLEFIDEHGLAGLQGFGDFGIHADRKVRAFVIGGGPLPRFLPVFISEPGGGPDTTSAGAIRAGLAE